MGNAGYGNHTENTKDYVDPERPDPEAGRKPSPEKRPGTEQGNSGKAPPAAGPHDKPSLTNPNATPGTGVLPEPGDREGTDSTSS
ncbi:hypothetical protein [Microvirga roseola]|uniref:hypothetical protein n=1 Tax=Microvirga roseola TaxID=2883126 RepID=UPI001E65B1AF|nr:hypothetical protein [Microvirga roseola]